MLWGEHPIGVRRLYSLVRQVTEPVAPASSESRPPSDAGAIRRMFPVRYSLKKEEGGDETGVREPRGDPPDAGTDSAALTAGGE